MLWTEKYRPKEMLEIIGQHSFTDDAKHWVINKDMPNVLLYGSPGTGKTSAGIVLAREILEDDFDVDFLELNASDDRKLETVRTKIKDFASSGKMGESPFKICLLDEIDGMTIDAQNALKRIMERYSNNVRFVITANDRNKIIFPLQSRCANYFFNLLSHIEVEATLLRIIKMENYENPEGLELFSKAFNGDLRRAISELQAAMAKGEILSHRISKSLERYAGLLKAMVQGEQDTVIDSLHGMVYDGITVKDICNGLHDALLDSDYDRAAKYKLLRVIGETEYRSVSMTPRVVISWMVAQTI